VTPLAEQERYADKIAKLLRKAESTTPEEAEALVAKAQELMTEYAISEELLARARGDNRAEREEVVQETIEFTGIFRQALYEIGQVITKANDCRAMHENVTWKRPHTTILYVIGYESDVRRVHLLNASVQIQAQGALAKWWRDQDTGWMSGMQKYKARREFLFAFARGLNDKLGAAREAGQRAAAAAKAQRDSVTSQEASESVALVVRDKKQRVNDWIDDKYGNEIRTVSRNYSRGSAAAEAAGYDAGQSADLNRGGRVGGRQRELT
jgi:hypothetical protein